MDTGTLLAVKTAAIAGWICGLFFLERWWPAVPRRGGWNRVLHNAGLWVVNIGLSPLVVVPVTAWAASLSWLDWRPAWLGGWTGLAVDLVLLDGLIYWWHRANHEIPVLWRFHEVHHLDGFLDVSSAVRFHLGEVLLSALARAAIVVLLDIPLASVLVFELLVLLSAVFHHSNLRLPPALEAGLARVVVTPSIHWVHHHAVRRDTDSNYATILSVWDRVFGSRSATYRTPDMPIGVEGRDDEALSSLLVAPFRRRTAPVSGPGVGTGRAR